MIDNNICDGIINTDNTEGRIQVFTLNKNDKSPIYVQIMQQLILFISTGLLHPEDKLPSVRELASDLGINPNTVARAYTELERRGIIETQPKVGAFVANRSLNQEVKKQAQEELTEWGERFFRFGIGRDELIAMLEAYVRKLEEGKDHNVNTSGNQ